jgi:hypothetical protein
MFPNNPSIMPGIKSTKIETEKRVFTIQGWIINGVQDYLILKNIEQEWGVGRGNLKFTSKAYKIWHESRGHRRTKASTKNCRAQAKYSFYEDQYKVHLRE